MSDEWQRKSGRKRQKLQVPNIQTPKKLQNPNFKLGGLLGALLVSFSIAGSGELVAQETTTNNTGSSNPSPAAGASADDIRALRQKIEELERIVKELEKREQPSVDDEKAKARTEELEQKVKALERNRELDVEAAETKAKEAPKIAIGSEGF